LTVVKDRNTSGGAVVKQVDFAYDAFNRLVKRTYDADGAGAGAATSQFWVYDEGINAVLQFDGSAGTNLSHRYLWTGVVDELIADEIVGSGADTLYALGDHLGTIRDIANYNESTSATTVTNHRTYNSFGKLTAETNAAVDLIFGYTGKQLDDATGLQHNLFRWYDSALGQWLSEDPLGFAAGDENLKRYVGNGSASHKDSLGLLDDDELLRLYQRNSILWRNGMIEQVMPGAALVRPLTPGELAIAQGVFGNTIDYTRVLISRTGWPMQGTNAVTPNGWIFFPPHLYLSNFSTANLNDRMWFVHEMTHVWQHQNGVDVADSGIMLSIQHAGHYHATYAYSNNDLGRPFSTFNIEQQAKIVENYYGGQIQGNRILSG
jgi:RHS repeat-associated protein